MLQSHSTHRVAMTTFWREFHHGKISPAWDGWGVDTLPLSLYLQAQAKLWCTLPYSSSTPICTLWLQYICKYTLFPKAK